MIRGSAYFCRFRSRRPKCYGSNESLALWAYFFQNKYLNGYSCKINTRTHNPLVVVRIDANSVSFKVKSVLTILDLFEFIFM